MRIVKVFLILLFACFSIHSYAQFSGLTPEKLWDFARISDPQLSPDGNWILFGITRYTIENNKGKRSLYIASLKSGEVRMVRDLLNSAYNARWRPDGKMIGFLSDKSGSRQLWEMNMNGDQVKQVTDFEHPINNFSYSPAMNYLSFSLEVKLDQTLQEKYSDLPGANAKIYDDLMYRHWDEWQDEKYNHLCIISYQNGKVIGAIQDLMHDEKYDWPRKPFGGPEDMAWSPDGSSLVYICKKYTGKDYATHTNSDLYLYDVASGLTANITHEYPGYDLSPSYSPNGKMISWLSMDRPGYESDQHEILVFDIKTGVIKNLTWNFDRDISSITWKTDRFLYFVGADTGTEQVFSLDLGSEHHEKINNETIKINRLTSGIHNISSIMSAGEDLAGIIMSMTKPSELYRISSKNGSINQLSAANDSILSTYRSGKVESRFIRTHDGKHMQVWIIFPPDFDPLKKYPALLYCQGGPHSQVSQFFSYRWNFQLMASRGYIIIAPNRRGLPGFGKEWNDAIRGNWGGDTMKDYLTAVDSMSLESYVDTEHIGAVGASFGGFSVYYLAGIHENRFKTFVSHCGVYNLESWYGSTEEIFFPNWEFEGAYWDIPKPISYDQYSPHRLVNNWNTPMLVIHGGRDFRIPYTQGMEAFNALQLRNIPSKFLFFPDENHWVLSPQNGILWHRVYFEWLDKWLKN